MKDENNYTPFYKTYLALCERENLSPTAAAKAAGISSGAPTAWKNKGAVPKPEQRQKLCNFFRVTEEELLGYKQKIDGPTLELGEPIGALANIPIVASVKAGYDGLAVEDDTGDFVQIPASMLKGYPEDECRAMHIRGDSMYPNMKDGDIVIVHLQEDVENGKVAVCIVNGDEGTIKRFFHYQNRVELWPDNPQIPKLTLIGSALENFRIYGQAIALIRDDL